MDMFPFKSWSVSFEELEPDKGDAGCFCFVAKKRDVSRAA
jgi:hypothetical protein